MGGVSLRDIEHWTAPSLISLLCVLQILLYCQLTFLLGGAGLVEHSPEAVLGVGGWESGGAEGLWELELECPLAKSSLEPSLLLSAPGRLPPRVFWRANVTT